jgi:hypothetical protein
MSVPVATRPKVYVCDRLSAEIVDLNPAGVMGVCCDCCVLSCCQEVVSETS